MYKLLIGLLFTATFCSAQVVKPAYKADSVTFTNADHSIRFSGTLTEPSTPKDFPTVVILSGTGKQDQDGNMAGHKEFKEIAEYLASKGIAVLRMDDRGTGNTTGVYETSTTGDFAEDALTAINYLKTRKEIDKAKIGLIGHSEGGAAMSIAASKSDDIKFLVSIAGLAMSGYNSLIKQNEDIVNASTLHDYDKKRSNDIDSLMFQTALKYADSADMEKKMNETYDAWKKKDSVYFASLHIEFDHFRFPIYSYVHMATGPWYRYFVKYNAEKVMSKIKVPILALNGDKDLMVSYKENLDNWKKYPAEGGNYDVTTYILPNLNHLFLPCQTCTIQEYAQIKSGFSPEALKIIADWINKIYN